MSLNETSWDCEGMTLARIWVRLTESSMALMSEGTLVSSTRKVLASGVFKKRL